MKKIILLAIFAILMIFNVAQAQNNSNKGDGLSCLAIAENYTAEAKFFLVLNHELFDRVKRGEQQVDEKIKNSIDKLSLFLKQHIDNKCNDANFVSIYADFVFTDEKTRRAYLTDILDDSKLTPAYCKSIRYAYNIVIMRSIVLGLTATQVLQSQLSGDRSVIEILISEGKSKTLGDAIGFPLLFADSGLVTLEMLQGMSNDQLQTVVDKVTELVSAYDYIEGFQKVRFKTFCPGLDIDTE